MSTADTCSQCGWAFDMEALRHNTCRKCRSAILITSVAYLERFDRPAIQKYIAQYSEVLKTAPEDRDALLALGICYIRLGLFDPADRFLDKLLATHPTDASGYFYKALAVLKGRRPRTCSLDAVKTVERLVLTAMELEPAGGRHELLLAAVRHDYYALNGLRMPPPTPDELIAASFEKYVDLAEADQGLSLLMIPDCPVRSAAAKTIK